MLKPDYIFEVSWEICNKVGGIHTVISTKAKTIEEEYGNKYILIGPDVWKETSHNPEFIEEKNRFKSWREKAEKKGLYFKVGRWNISGSPIVILLDFTTFFATKDSIFAELWESYQLDSLNGQWDYIEPALFGWGAAQVIESFYQENITAQESIVAQFHEWLTGTGVLYLKKHVPQIACAFTTHATVIGRTIAGNGLPLYENIEQYNPEVISNLHNVHAKYSVEKLAAKHSDAFTTVSLITANECKYFLGIKPDVITPNGFEPSFVPSDEDFPEKRALAREKLFKVAEAVFNQEVPRESKLMITSGRYEFHNKGIDLFIEALAAIQNDRENTCPVLAYITVPAGHLGARRNIIERIESPDFSNPKPERYLTHTLLNASHDPIMNKLREFGLLNMPGSKVKVVFVPSYLNGDDGLFNMHYYDLLIGFDLSIFPSYYEPWGYTPLESIAFHIPTVTTTLAGFGIWAELLGFSDHAVKVILRNDHNSIEVVQAIAKQIRYICSCSEDQIQVLRTKAYQISNSALWEKLIIEYQKAYTIAIEKAMDRADQYANKTLPTESLQPATELNKPVWKKLLIKTFIPKSLEKLQKLARNLWWSWNFEVHDLFEMIDPALWKESGSNPILLLELLSFDDIKKLETRVDFIEKLNEIYKSFENYLSEKPNPSNPSIAYFSMEFGLHNTLKIFSGGLGMLAGDYLKQASDTNVNMIGIGLLYRQGYFNQSISLNGGQINQYYNQKFSQLPLIPVLNEDNSWLKISLALPGRTLYAKVWKVEVGRVCLYLMDTDIDENTEYDRLVTFHLYGGENENRFKQELLLGVGGIRLLEALKIKPDIFHCNEGHAAFAGLERLRKYVVEHKLTFDVAVEMVRASSLFTTHTAVAAGHDVFPEDILRTYIPHYPDRLKISWDEFMNLGKMQPDPKDTKFQMSALAIKLSQETNGVSKIHGVVSRELFKNMFPGFYPNELYIDYVTNGVHFPTWISRQWLTLYKKYLGEDFLYNHDNPEKWKNIQNVPDKEIWDVKNSLRSELICHIKERLNENLTLRQENPKYILKTIDAIDESALTIGFARRFASYKRAHLLFNNLERLAYLCNIPGMPVQFIFAGKAHPKDIEGQNLIKKIIEISRLDEFIGKITFVENYDIELAKKLVSGCDIWLNTPMRPLEASGTSGEKAIMNGVINLSVLDGWWAEGYKEGAGWALKESFTYSDHPMQDVLDAETIYNLLEDEIIPLYYNRNSENIPSKWISHVKNTISEISPFFTTHRMLEDYKQKFYSPLNERYKKLAKGDFCIARDIVSWKKRMEHGWNQIEITEMNIPDSKDPLFLGDVYKASVTIDTGELEAEDIGIEVLFGRKEDDMVKKILFSHELEIVERKNNIVTFACEVPIAKVGVYDYSFRMFAKNDQLPHRQDFGMLKWI